MQISQSCIATSSLLHRTIRAYLLRNEINSKPTGTAMILTHIVRLLRMWRRYEASYNQLSRLDERGLRDIGLTRSEIPAAAWKAAESVA